MRKTYAKFVKVGLVVLGLILCVQLYLRYDHDVQHDVSHDVKHDVSHDVKHDANHDVNHDVKHDANHDVNHEASHDVMHNVNHDVNISEKDQKETEIELEKSQTSVRILCMVTTDPSILSKARAVKNTWMQHCDFSLFMSSKEDKRFPTIGLNVTAGRSHNAEKSREAWIHVYENYLDKADFFIKADPDSYIIIENLKEYLRHCNTSEPHFYGHTLILKQSSWKRFRGFYAAGVAIVLTRESVRRLGTHLTQGNEPKCFAPGQFEDFKTGVCLANVGVKLVDTRDIYGKETFLPPLPLMDFRINNIPDWYPKYRASIGACMSWDCFSDYPISFHYVDNKQMYAMYYLLTSSTLGGFRQFRAYNGGEALLRFNGSTF